MENYIKNMNRKYDRVMPRINNRSRSSLKSSSTVTRHDIPSSNIIGAKPSVSNIGSSVFSELPVVLNDYVPESSRERSARRTLVIKPRKTVKSLDPALSPHRSVKANEPRKKDHKLASQSSAPSVMFREQEKWSDSHVDHCLTSKSHSKLKELKDEIKAYSNSDKLTRLRSHLYKSCGVVLGDMGQVAADKAVQVEDIESSDGKADIISKKKLLASNNSSADEQPSEKTFMNKLIHGVPEYCVAAAPPNMTDASELERVWALDSGFYNNTEREFVSRLISLYRDQPILWNIKHRYYLDKYKRAAALKEMTKILKTYRPEFTEDILKRKINTLRTNFNKQIRKLKMAKRSTATGEDAPRPVLWYYEDMLFLTDQMGNSDSESSTQSHSRIIKKTHEKKRNEKKPTNTTDESTQVHAESESFKGREYESDIMSKNWAIKLNRLAPDQRRYAEKIINDVLFEGEMGTLTRHGVQFPAYASQCDGHSSPNPLSTLSVPVKQECTEEIEEESYIIQYSS